MVPKLRRSGYGVCLPHAAFSPDGRYALLYTRLDELVLLDIAEGDVLAECRRSLEDQTESRGSSNRRIALAPDARNAALRTSGGTNVTGGWSRIEVWNLGACESVAERQMGQDDPEAAEALAFTADGAAVLYWARDLARSWRGRVSNVVEIGRRRNLRVP